MTDILFILEILSRSCRALEPSVATEDGRTDNGFRVVRRLSQKIALVWGAASKYHFINKQLVCFVNDGTSGNWIRSDFSFNVMLNKLDQ